MKDFVNLIGGFSDIKFAPFGFWWLGWIVATIICSAFAFKLCYKKHLQRYFLSCGIIMLFTLLYRLFIFSFKSGEFSFDLNALPITAFDVPVFTILLAGIFMKGKIHDLLSSFNASFGGVLGALVIFIPNSLPSGFIGVAIGQKLNALLTIVIAVVNLKSYSKSFKIFDFLMGFCIFFGAFILVEGCEFILASLVNLSSPCFFGNYFESSYPIFSHLLSAFPHILVTFIFALLLAEISAGIHYLAFKLSTRKKRY
ncbi:MAG: hypothetical protein IJW64_05610 [Clostridia bacterium]|nr:hypothetical protein [Clostridia bacterium]